MEQGVMLPWHEAAWPQFAAQLKARRHHAWLIHGVQGTGKWELALEIARARLCRAPSPNFRACGACASCRALTLNADSETSFSHPDFVLLMPSALRADKGIPLPLSAQKEDTKSASKEILVEDMREATDALALSAHHAQGRVCVVYPAEAMNAITANTLLKTLEEPPGDTLFLLVTHQRNALLPTLRSRCLAVAAPVPSESIALHWLQAQDLPKDKAELAWAMSGNRPLSALALTSNAPLLEVLSHVSQTGKWQALKRLDLKATPVSALLPFIQRWLCDIGRMKSGSKPLCFKQQPATQSLQHAALAHSWGKLRELERSINLLVRQARHPVNAALMLEALLVQLAASH
jgi:DNA polymerase III subunit delta'